MLHVLTALSLPVSACASALRTACAPPPAESGAAEWYTAPDDPVAIGSLAAQAPELPADPDDWSWGWGRSVIDVNPMDCWRSTNKPDPVILGGRDPSVPTESSAERLRTLGPRVEVQAMDDMGHALSAPESPLIDAGVLRRIVAWLEEVNARKGGEVR